MMPQLEEDSLDFGFQQDGTPPQDHLKGYIIKHFPQRWIGRIDPDEEAVLRWPLRSPDMTQRDFLWSFIKNKLCPTVASRSSGSERADQWSLYCGYRRHADLSIGRNGISTRYLLLQ